MLIVTYRVKHLPDLEKTEYNAKYGDDPASRLLEIQGNFLYKLHTVANQYSLTYSLIYSYNPDEPDQDKKLQILVRVKVGSEVVLGKKNLEEIKAIFKNSFLHDFYKIEELEKQAELDLNWVEFISFGIKKEEKILPTVKRKKSPSHYYLIQPFEQKEGMNMMSVCSKLEADQKRALIEIVIQPTALMPREQEQLDKLLQNLGTLTSPDFKTSPISGAVIEEPIDPVAERALKLFEDLRDTIQSQPLYEISVRVLAENRFNASLLLNEFWVELSQKPLYREIGMSKEDRRFELALKSVKEGGLFSPAIWTEYWSSLPKDNPLIKLHRLHRLFTVEEASAFFKVVVPDPVVVFSGIRKETDLKSESDDSILLGWQAGKLNNQAQVPLKNFNKHVFICGVPGSGKTTAVLNLLFQLWTEHGIPFLVIEPAKTEYRAMLSCSYNEEGLEKDDNRTTKLYTKTRDVDGAIAKMQADLQVYSLGNERVCPFRFNPFMFFRKTTLDEHISTLEASFKGAMPLFNPLPALLAEGIEQVYAQLGWQPQYTAEEGLKHGLEFPNMQELYEAITDILETKEYSSEIRGNIKTSLEVRIGSLLRRSVGNMLNTPKSLPDIKSLMKRPVILEMDALNEEQANLMTMFLLGTLRQYVRATRKSGSSLEHVVVIEEAHNIVGTDAGQTNEEGGANPKVEATKYIVRMLAEMRALGQGMIIADQLPSAVSDEVVKNTNVKIAHRTVSGDDREILKQSMLLTEIQSQELARAMPGDAYLFMEGTYKPVRIKEPNTKLIYGIEEPPSDEELVNNIENKEFYQKAIQAKDHLHKQKVERYSERVIEQLKIMSKETNDNIIHGKEILAKPVISLKKNIPKQINIPKNLNTYKQRIEKKATELHDFAIYIETTVKNLKKELKNKEEKSRWEGIYQDVYNQEKNPTNNLEQELEELSEIGKDCSKVSKFYSQIDVESWNQFQRYYNKYFEGHDNYFRAAHRLSQKIDRKVPEDEIVKDYDELELIRVDTFGQLFDTITEYIINLKFQPQKNIFGDTLQLLEDKVYAVRDSVVSIHEKIKADLEKNYPQEAELDFEQAGDVPQGKNDSQIDIESRRQLQSYYRQYVVAYENYLLAADRLSQNIDRKVPEDEIVKDYDELELIRVDTFGQLFDTITEYIINLKSQTQKNSLRDTLQSLEDEVYEISDSVVSIDEGIKANFEKSYPQETESDFKQVGDVAQSENYSQIIDVESRSQLQSCYKQYIAACKNYFLAAKRLRQKIDRKVPEDEIVKDYDELESIRVDTFGELFDTITEYIINLKSQTQNNSLLDTLQSLEDKVYEISYSVGSTNEKIQANFEKNY